MTLEEILSEYDRRICKSNYRKVDDLEEIENLRSGTDTLLDELTYPESDFELDKNKVREMVRSAYEEGFKQGRNG